METRSPIKIVMLGFQPDKSAESPMGIYTIEHENSKKQYHGSTCNIRRRKNEHVTSLSRGRHRNPGLQKLANVDPIFTLDFMSTSSIQEAKRLEQERIDQTPKELLLNESWNTEHHFRGLWDNPRTRQAMTESRLGNTYGLGYKMSSQQCEAHSKRIAGNQYALGYKHSEDSKKKISKSHLGIPKSPEAIAKGAEHKTKNRVVINDTVYQNASIAAKEIGMSRVGVIKRCRSTNFPEYKEIAK